MQKYYVSLCLLGTFTSLVAMENKQEINAIAYFNGYIVAASSIGLFSLLKYPIAVKGAQKQTVFAFLNDAQSYGLLSGLLSSIDHYNDHLGLQYTQASQEPFIKGYIQYLKDKNVILTAQDTICYVSEKFNDQITQLSNENKKKYQPYYALYRQQLLDLESEIRIKLENEDEIKEFLKQNFKKA